MEILFHRYGSICEPDIIEAFRSLGVEVIEEDREIYEKNIPSDVRIKILAEQILTKKPAFVFSINYFPYISEICQKLNLATSVPKATFYQFIKSPKKVKYFD